MIHFECDYAEGALPHIMDLMMKTFMPSNLKIKGMSSAEK